MGAFIRNLCLVIALLVFSTNSFGSYSIVIFPSNPYSFGSKDFWNFNIIYAGAGEQVKLRVLLKNASGVLVVEATKSVLLNNGSNLLKSDGALLLYYDKQLEASDRNNRSFPSGSFSYCVELTNSSGVVVSQCNDIGIELISPPVLINLADGSEIENQFPSFSWLPPVPVYEEVTYTLTIAEIYDGQTALDAVLRNPPRHKVSGLGQNFYTYPVSALSLEKGKKYAWQVRADKRDNNVESNRKVNYMGESEVWEFSLKKTVEEKINFISYVSINGKDDSYIHPASDSLKVIYQEKYAATELSYEITDATGNSVDRENNLMTSVPGENRFEIPIWILGLNTTQVYVLTVKNKRNELYRLKFQFHEKK